jgi:RNA polymerase sigma-70 factor (ECF subfamily)
MDTEVVVRAQAGDEEAFATIAGAIGNRLYGVARRILRDASLAQDATQQALLDIWRFLPKLRDPDRFDAWAYRLLVNACSDEGRRSGRRTSVVRLLPTDDSREQDATAAVADRDQLERAFRRLSTEHRAVVVLHHFLDLTVEETAESLGVPVATVRSRLRYAMRGLRAAVEADARSVAGEAAR